jgi:hypothetical protein
MQCRSYPTFGALFAAGMEYFEQLASPDHTQKPQKQQQAGPSGKAK